MSTETLDQLVTRIAYYNMEGIAKGTSATRLASDAAHQVILWQKEREKENLTKAYQQGRDDTIAQYEKTRPATLRAGDVRKFDDEWMVCTDPDIERFVSFTCPDNAPKVSEISKPQLQVIKSVIQDLIDEVDRNTCPHEDTHRGGNIWTICDGCGAKWADDEGGFVDHVDSDAMMAARKMVSWIETDPGKANDVNLNLFWEPLMFWAAQSPQHYSHSKALRNQARAKKLLELLECDRENRAHYTSIFPNGCDRTVPEALRYLATNPRPQGGEQRFNGMHLEQLAGEIERAVKNANPRS